MRSPITEQRVPAMQTQCYVSRIGKQSRAKSATKVGLAAAPGPMLRSLSDTGTFQGVLRKLQTTLRSGFFCP